MMELIEKLIWPALIIIVLFMFRSEARKLLERLISIKHKDTEIQFQDSSKDSLPPEEFVSRAMDLRDEEGFFRHEAIIDLVNQSKYLGESEEVKDSILVYQTLLQRTWLVATKKQIFYILDDEKTRASRRLIQIRQPISEDMKISAEFRKHRTGNFKINSVGPWLYSIDLLGPSKTAKLRLSRFISEAMKQNA